MPMEYLDEQDRRLLLSPYPNMSKWSNVITTLKAISTMDGYACYPAIVIKLH